MAKYRIVRKETREYYIYIEAENEEEARLLEEEVNSCFYHDDTDGFTNWEFCYIDELDDDADVDFTAEEIRNGEAE